MLYGQCLYRLERYDEALEVFTKINKFYNYIGTDERDNFIMQQTLLMCCKCYLDLKKFDEFNECAEDLIEVSAEEQGLISIIMF
ncbi:hypothetical protein BIY23_01550 [Wolbachia pipientis]|uniref:Tetratricopeptide repeat protein n=2 Tax=Wolbachia pipientis TaxID=955 RepID=A0A1E7QKZ5_WOLPI|nr:hypothetical protein BIY23_01550 [Wolbachia pipientis]